MLTQERIKDLANDCDYELYRDYSGRGMMGKRCCAIVSDDTLIRTISNFANSCDDISELQDILRGMRTDDMGRSMIVYWPKIAVTDDVA